MARIALSVNGKSTTIEADPDTPLLYVLRNDLGLHAAKFGCGVGECGACTVLVGSRAVRSCITRVSAVGTRPIITVEGLGSPERPHPLQAAFIEAQAAQCGYCVAGIIMSAKALLDRTPRPTETAVREALAGHLCRCGTHMRIIRAVLEVARVSGSKG